VGMVATVVAMLADNDPAGWIARVTLLVYVMVQWPRLTRVAHILVGVALVFVGAAVYIASDPATLILTALDRFCFFATFIAALGLLRVPSSQSQLVRDAGAVLIRQRPTWRY